MKMEVRDVLRHREALGALLNVAGEIWEEASVLDGFGPRLRVVDEFCGVVHEQDVREEAFWDKLLEFREVLEREQPRCVSSLAFSLGLVDLKATLARIVVELFVLRVDISNRKRERQVRASMEPRHLRIEVRRHRIQHSRREELAPFPMCIEHQDTSQVGKDACLRDHQVHLLAEIRKRVACLLRTHSEVLAPYVVVDVARRVA